MTNERQSQREGAEARERTRGYALQNLNSQGLSNLAVSYHAQAKESGFGETDNSAVEQFLYAPSIKGSEVINLESGKKSDLIYDALLGSREDGRRYSGQVSEYGNIKNAAKVIQDSLLSVKVSDVIGLLGSKIPVKKEYEDKYVVELFMSENKEEKEVGHAIVEAYMSYKTNIGVSSALDMRAKAVRGGLEKLLGAEEGNTK